MRIVRRVCWLILPVAFWGVGCANHTPSSAAQDPFYQQRLEMVERQLQARDIRSPQVLRAMRLVPRHEFVPAQLSSQAYNDHPLPIGEGQTISQPYIVALMSQLAEAKRNERALEIGTGSGYQAAVLAQLVDHVYSIEIVAPLAERAATTLRRMGYPNISLRQGDGYQGWPEEAPFDIILVTAASPEIPQPLLDQLGEGGRLIMPVGPAGGVQSLMLIRRRNGQLTEKRLIRVRFVPLTRSP